MKENSTFRETRKNNDLKLIAEGSIFNNDLGKKQYFLKNVTNASGAWLLKSDLLKNGKNNLYPQIVDEVVLYFALNKIAFHHLEGDEDSGFCIPSGHTLSSQISCLNHLYPLRYDKNAVLSIAQILCPDITEVFLIETDNYLPGYISFEVVSVFDHLNEIKGDQKLTRGTMCTSIDAMIYGRHKDGYNIIIPIEWKYTENYNDDDKIDKDYSVENRGTVKEGKGKERLKRYSDLISKSEQLSLKKEDYKNSVYFFEPFYQLMRQTLWAEQVISNKEKETLNAQSFVHAHIVPKANNELLQYIYPVSGEKMSETWKSCLADADKYILVDPQSLLANVDKVKYQSLLSYLKVRYWNEDL